MCLTGDRKQSSNDTCCSQDGGQADGLPLCLGDGASNSPDNTTFFRLPSCTPTNKVSTLPSLLPQVSLLFSDWTRLDLLRFGPRHVNCHQRIERMLFNFLILVLINNCSGSQTLNAVFEQNSNADSESVGERHLLCVYMLKSSPCSWCSTDSNTSTSLTCITITTIIATCRVDRSVLGRPSPFIGQSQAGTLMSHV